MGSTSNIVIPIIVNLVIVVITFTVVYIIYKYIKANPFELYCVGCTEPGWWYKCSSGTGIGSPACVAFDAAQGINDDISTTYTQLAAVINDFPQNVFEIFNRCNWMSIRNTKRQYYSR